MRFLSTLIFTLTFGICLAQDSIDTVIKGDAIYLYKKGLIVERYYMKGDKIDLRIVYVYRDGVLVRREWWRDGKRTSYTIEN
jgi:predicted nuclease with RNAse H fold